MAIRHIIFGKGKEMTGKDPASIRGYAHDQSYGGLGKFVMKFNYQRGIEHPFFVEIMYDQNKDIPLSMKFLEFELKSVLHNALNCKHACVQNRWVRFFIKNVPPKVKPFSLKLEVCPDCGAPMSYRFITYPGDLRKYPKVRDLPKYKNRIITPDNQHDIPKAIQGEYKKIGVN